jgi:FixJ family two-component response regulator
MVQPRLVFVVDDDSSARNGLTRLLRTAGHDVRAFASAEEFLDAFDPEISGCLVLDSRMPGMSGQEFQAELAARGAGLPIIIVSADADLDSRRAARRLNAAAFFRKPVDGSALLDAIDWAARWNLMNSTDDESEKTESNEPLRQSKEDRNEHRN